jgi:hypothetical protein
MGRPHAGFHLHRLLDLKQVLISIYACD